MGREGKVGEVPLCENDAKNTSFEQTYMTLAVAIAKSWVEGI